MKRLLLISLCFAFVITISFGTYDKIYASNKRIDVFKDICDANVIKFLKSKGVSLYDMDKFCYNVKYMMEEENIERYTAIRKSLLLSGYTKKEVDNVLGKTNKVNDLKKKAFSKFVSQDVKTNFSFANILWSDNIDKVRLKLDESELFTKVILVENEHNTFSIDRDLWDDTISNYNEKFKKCPHSVSLNHMIYANPSNVPPQPSSPAEGAEFVFNSSTGQLLAYIILVKPNSAQDVYNSITKKYKIKPKSVKTNSHQKKWVKFVKNDEIIYFSTQFGSGQPCIVAYVKQDNLNNVINICNEVDTIIKSNKKKKSNAF